MIDFKSLVIDPAYSIFGTDAVITFNDDQTLDLVVIDKTSGVVVGADAQIGTVEPGAVARVEDIENAGRDLADLDQALIRFNDACWRVMSHHPKPTPSGRSSGEVVMILEAAE